MAKSKKDKKEKKLKVEKVGGKKEVKKEQGTSKLEDLRKEAISLGMPESDANEFDSEKLLQSTIKALKSTKETPAEPTVPQEKADPKEEKQVEQKWRAKRDRQKAYFDKQPQIRVLIPLDPNAQEKPGVVEEREINGRMEWVAVSGAVWSKTFNGYRIIVPKGVYWPVPKDVADNIAAEQNQIIMDAQRYGVDRVDPKTGKAVREQL